MSPSTNTSSGGGLDVKTLVITAAASATAAYVTSEIWAPGTLASAALTPVIVALVKEALDKPATVVTRAVPVRGVVRSASHPGDPYDPVQPTERDPQRVPLQGEVAGVSRAAPRHAWSMAVVTGLLGFIIAAVIITVPEFVAGNSASGGDRKTTIFGGESKKSDDRPSTTDTPTTPDEEEGVPPASTVTVPPVETTTVPPAETTTVPPVETTPAPPAQPQPPPEDEGVN